MHDKGHLATQLGDRARRRASSPSVAIPMRAATPSIVSERSANLNDAARNTSHTVPKARGERPSLMAESAPGVMAGIGAAQSGVIVADSTRVLRRELPEEHQDRQAIHPATRDATAEMGR